MDNFLKNLIALVSFCGTMKPCNIVAVKNGFTIPACPVPIWHFSGLLLDYEFELFVNYFFLSSVPSFMCLAESAQTLLLSTVNVNMSM